MIIQNSVNLNLIAVCHGEAQWACVREQRFTTHRAARLLLLFEVTEEAVAGDQLNWSTAIVHLSSVTAKSLDVVWKAQPVFSIFRFAESYSQTPEKVFFKGTITQHYNAELLAEALSLTSIPCPASREQNVARKMTPFWVSGNFHCSGL